MSPKIGQNGLIQEKVSKGSTVGYSSRKLRALALMQTEGISFSEAMDRTQPIRRKLETVAQRNARFLREAQAEVDALAPNA